MFNLNWNAASFVNGFAQVFRNAQSFLSRIRMGRDSNQGKRDSMVLAVNPKAQLQATANFHFDIARLLQGSPLASRTDKRISRPTAAPEQRIVSTSAGGLNSYRSGTLVSNHGSGLGSFKEASLVSNHGAGLGGRSIASLRRSRRRGA